MLLIKHYTHCYPELSMSWCCTWRLQQVPLVTITHNCKLQGRERKARKLQQWPRSQGLKEEDLRQKLSDAKVLWALSLQAILFSIHPLYSISLFHAQGFYHHPTPKSLFPAQMAPGNLKPVCTVAYLIPPLDDTKTPRVSRAQEYTLEPVPPQPGPPGEWHQKACLTSFSLTTTSITNSPQHLSSWYC